MASALVQTPIGDEQTAVLEFLRRPATFAPDETAREIDTHAANIFLAGDQAWKLKSAVRFGYLDFSAADKRRDALRTELLLNRRTAPDLYLAVVPITCDDAGRLAIDGVGEPIDWLLKMRRFPDDALFAHLADRGLLDAGTLTRLTDRIVAFHADAEVVRCENAEARFRAVIDGNAASLNNFPEVFPPPAAASLCETHRMAAGALGQLLDERGRTGRVRHAHGDLHLANIALIEGEPTLFDCLEFSPELATIDILYDVAFLIMDLWHRDMRTEANIVFNRYLDLSRADEGGVALMPLFTSVRATIRAHVMAAQARRPGADRTLADQAWAYLDLAIAAMVPCAPRLVAIGGLSGTGKSSLARVLGSEIGRLPGARILRNDILRKRLAGVPPETRLDRTAYTANAADLVYQALDTAASAALGNGYPVIADAVFASVEDRNAIEAVADAASCHFQGIWLTAPDKTRLKRIGLRTADASDATTDVALAQSNIEIGHLGSWQPLSVDAALEQVVSDARVMISAAQSNAESSTQRLLASPAQQS